LAEVDRYLRFLDKQGGSDLHLSAFCPPMIRLHGTMIPLKVDPLEPGQTESMLTEIMPRMNREEFERSSDTDFAYDLR